MNHIEQMRADLDGNPGNPTDAVQLSRFTIEELVRVAECAAALSKAYGTAGAPTFQHWRALDASLEGLLSREGEGIPGEKPDA